MSPQRPRPCGAAPLTRANGPLGFAGAVTAAPGARTGLICAVAGVGLAAVGLALGAGRGRRARASA